MKENQVYNFTNEIDEIEVKSRGAKIIIVPHDEDGIRAVYENPADKPEICAVLQGKKLILKETPIYSVFCNRSFEDYKLTVSLPKKSFDKIYVGTYHGGVSVSDVDAKEFHLSTASGNIDVAASFESIGIESASGNITLRNTAESPAKSLKITAVSGNIEVEAAAEKYSITSVSGKTVYKNASGEGSINVTSGSVGVDYAEWRGDLSVSAVSGDIRISVPDGSGADISFDGVSGTMKTDLGNDKGNLINIGKGTQGILGGDNQHKLNVKTVSGSVVVARQ